MLELFRLDAQGQIETLTAGLLALERTPSDPRELENCMRAAHSLKGAARVVGVVAGAVVALPIEKFFSAAQHGTLVLRPESIDVLKRGVELLARIASEATENGAGLTADDPAIQTYLAALAEASAGTAPAEVSAAIAAPVGTSAVDVKPVEASAVGVVPVEASAVGVVPVEASAVGEVPVRTSAVAISPLEVSAADVAPVRARAADVVPVEVSAVGAGPIKASAEGRAPAIASAAEKVPAPEHLTLPKPRKITAPLTPAPARTIATREGIADPRVDEWDQQLAALRLHLLGEMIGLITVLDELRDAMPPDVRASSHGVLAAAYRAALGAQSHVAKQLEGFASCQSRSGAADLPGANKRTRIRSFAEAAAAYTYYLDELAQARGKHARLEVVGATVQLDAITLERLDSPVRYLLYDLLEHGIESESERRAAGKPLQGRVTLRASYSAGKLTLTVSDDGRGIDVSRVREAIVERQLVTADVACSLSDAAVLEFLFVPGFAPEDTGLGRTGDAIDLNAVQTMLKALGGTVRVSSQPGAGTRFVLVVPLRHCVVPALIAEVANIRCAFPLRCVARTVELDRCNVASVEGHYFFDLEGERIRLASTQPFVRHKDTTRTDGVLSIIIIEEPGPLRGLVVDRLIGPADVLVPTHEADLAKVGDVGSVAFLADNSAVVMVDIDEFIRPTERGDLAPPKRKRILVVDDSLTLREVERYVLDGAGYFVEVSVDGRAAWDAVQAAQYDLVVTDTDMPHMDGIELITRMKSAAQLQSVPAIIVSSKDSEEDRRRAREAGADCLLSKGSFQNETLLRAVFDLIGSATA